jgi:hydrogenase maturation protease
MGDDGFGPAVVRALEARYVVGNEATRVEVVDLGTPGLDLTPWLADADRVVIVDTVNSAAPPGTLRVYHKQDLLRQASPGGAASPRAQARGPHDPGVKETIRTLEFAGRAPEEITIVGIVPARVEPGLALSPLIQAAVDPAVAAIVAELELQGVEVRRRTDVRADRPWWQTNPPGGHGTARHWNATQRGELESRRTRRPQ